MKELWVEKYRPKAISEYVFRDDKQKDQVISWIKSGTLPHLLFTGAAGTGKTTIAKLLLRELKVDEGDVLIINASLNNGIDYIRDTILNFSSSMPFGDFKYILLDEADHISTAGQAALRNVMETYSNTCRFILTGNYPQKILPAIHSRCQGFHIESLDMPGFTARVAEILISEGVEFTEETLDILNTYVTTSYPDMRKCINMVQMNSQTGQLIAPSAGEAGMSDSRIEMVELFKKGQYKQARDLICSQITLEEYEDMFRFMYKNLELWGDTDDKKNECILIIRNGLVKHTSCADPEINLSATFIELQMVALS